MTNNLELSGTLKFIIHGTCYLKLNESSPCSMRASLAFWVVLKESKENWLVFKAIVQHKTKQVAIGSLRARKTQMRLLEETVRCSRRMESGPELPSSLVILFSLLQCSYPVKSDPVCNWFCDLIKKEVELHFSFINWAPTFCCFLIFFLRSENHFTHLNYNLFHKFHLLFTCKTQNLHV